MRPKLRLRFRSLSTLTLLVGAVGLAAGCATTRAAADDPLTLEPRAFAGTVLSGPLAERDPDQLPWSGALGVETRWSYRAAPEAGAVPLTGRLVVVEGAGETFGARARLAQDALQLDADAAWVRLPEDAWQARFLQALPAGVTLATGARPNPNALAPAWSALTLEVSRSLSGPDEVQVALVLEGMRSIGPDEDEEDDDARASEPSSREVRERLVLAPLAADETLRLFLPAPDRRRPTGGVVIELRLSGDGGMAFGADAFEVAVGRSQELVRAAHRSAMARGAELEGGFRFESAQAMQALERRALQRPALVFLAQSTEARLTEDLALLAEAEPLGEFLSTIAARLAELEAPPDGPAPFGWFLERNAWRWLCLRAEDESRTLEPELAALLARHAGELSRYPDLVREVLGTSRDAAALHTQIRNENRLFLEDAHPASRVRAYDWLVEHATVPAGYNPLGEAAERRAALVRADQETAALAAQATEAGQ